MSTNTPRVEVYVRSLAPTVARAEQERVLSRLDALTAEGRLADFEVAICGDCVCPSAKSARTGPGKRLLSRYGAFERWAAKADRELVGFDERDTRSVVTDTTVTGIVFPRLTLAEYRDGDLTFVAPSRNGVETTSVLDRIDTY